MEHFMDKPVREIMTTEVLTLSPENTIQEASALFAKHSIHHIPVLRGHHLVGIISREDFAKLADQAAKTQENMDMLYKASIQSIMHTGMATLTPEQPIGVAAEVFLSNRIHSVLIVEGERFVGIVTSFDVLKHCFKVAYPQQQFDD